MKGWLLQNEREHCPKCKSAMPQCLQEKEEEGRNSLFISLFYCLNCVCVHLTSWFLISQLVQFPLAVGRFELSESSTPRVSPLVLTREGSLCYKVAQKTGLWCKSTPLKNIGNPMLIITLLGNRSFWSCVGIRYMHNWKHQFNSAGAPQILQVALEMLLANQAGTSNWGIARLQEN